MQSKKKEVERILTAYSDALNASDITSLASLYTESAVFMPAGFHSITGREEIKRSAERFFKQKQLSLSFTVEDIVFEGEFAFVEAKSRCTVHPLPVGKEVSTLGKDFFVLQKVQQQWKVFRYMFNVV
jgi:uncharacterized protein (TIGR02246 family)